MGRRKIAAMTEVRPKVESPSAKQRCGRGFSREELKKAGTNLTEALKLAIPVDSRRRTFHEENVEAVKSLIQSRKPPPKAKAKRKGKPKS
jgi:large subunit ribosomal protein L13e